MQPIKTITNEKVPHVQASIWWNGQAKDYSVTATLAAPALPVIVHETIRFEIVERFTYEAEATKFAEDMLNAFAQGLEANHATE